MEDHHDVALVDETGKLVAKQRIKDDADGFRRLLALLAEAGDCAEAPIPVAVETARGLVFACLRTTGRKVYSINPMAVARYRERHRSARAKSDHADAMTSANILGTDADVHRPLPADSELVRAIAVLARAQQDTVWNRAQLNNQLRSHLKQYYPAALAAFAVRGVGLDSREARAVLAAAPDPHAAARLPRAQLRAALRRSGRQRNIEVWVERLHTIFTGDHLHQPPLVEQAMRRQTLALVAQLDPFHPVPTRLYDLFLGPPDEVPEHGRRLSGSSVLLAWTDQRLDRTGGLPGRCEAAAQVGHRLDAAQGHVG